MMLSHSPKPIFIGLFSLTAAAFTFAVCGCQASRPMGNLFQVTRHDSTAAGDIDAPRQRLASAKPRAGSVFGNGSQRESSNQTANRSNQTIRQVSYEEDLDDSQLTSVTPLPGSNAKFAQNKKRQWPAEADQSLTSSEGMDNLSDDELMAAFAGTSPEVKEQALRQLVAVLSRNAERTDQPAPLATAIEESLQQEHHLPNAKNQPAAEPPKRLAMSSELVNKETASSEDVFDLPEENLETSAEPHEAVVHTLSDRDSDSVRTASATKSKNADAMIQIAALQSPADPDSLSDHVLYEALLKRIAMPVEGENDADRARRMITARHLMVLAGNPDAAVGKIEGMTDKEQEYLRHQLLGLWTMVDPEGHPVQSRRFSSALPQLREATRYLAAATDSLEVRSLAFCTEILAYGQIKKFNSSVFKPSQQVILYCEVDNFVASKVDAGYQTHLQGSYDILNADNQKVASQLLPADQQVSANYLRDYFIAYQMHLPQNLAAGKYRLQLTMEDIEGKKYGQNSIAFEIQ